MKVVIIRELSQDISYVHGLNAIRSKCSPYSGSMMEVLGPGSFVQLPQLVSGWLRSSGNQRKSDGGVLSSGRQQKTVLFTVASSFLP